MSDEARDAVAALNTWARAMMTGGKRPQAPKQKSRYIYWFTPKGWTGTVYRFGYTPWKQTIHDVKAYWALKYRIYKDGSRKLVKAVKFAKRRVAKARAYKWYVEYYLPKEVTPDA